MSFVQSMPYYHVSVYESQHQSDSFIYHNSDMTTLATRLITSRKAKGLSQEELAKKAGLKSQSIIGMLESGARKSSSYIPQIAEALGVDAVWLATGKFSKRKPDLLPLAYIQGEVTGVEYESPNVEPTSKTIGKIPVISYVQAGEFAEVVDNFSPGASDEWADTTKPVNRYTFALRVTGDSMEPLFPAGTIIVVEPEMEPAPGDYIIAKNGDAATFKQLVSDAGEWYLKPLNDRYPIKLLGEARIIGVVREAISSFR